VPSVFAERKARTELATYSSGVFTFCNDPPWLRNNSEAKMVRRIERILPLRPSDAGVFHAVMHWRISSASADRLGSV
jgi:hypothetical protein